MSEELKTLEIGIDCAPGDIRPDAYIGLVASIFGLTEIPETTSRFFGAWTWHFKIQEEVFKAKDEEARGVIRGLYQSGMIRGAQWGLVD